MISTGSSWTVTRSCARTNSVVCAIASTHRPTIVSSSTWPSAASRSSTRRTRPSASPSSSRAAVSAIWLLDPLEVGLGPGQHRVGVARGVQGEGELRGEPLGAQPRVAVGAVEPGPQPVEVLVECGHRGVPGRLDLAAQRRLLAERALELGGEQRAGAGELADRRLDVHPGHRAERRARPGQPLRHGGQPAGDRRAGGHRAGRSRGPATCRWRCPGWRPAGPTRSRAAARARSGAACSALRRMSASTWSAACSAPGRRGRGRPAGAPPRRAPRPAPPATGRRGGRRSGGRPGRWPTPGAVRAARRGRRRPAGGSRRSRWWGDPSRGDSTGEPAAQIDSRSRAAGTRQVRNGTRVTVSSQSDPPRLAPRCRRGAPGSVAGRSPLADRLATSAGSPRRCPSASHAASDGRSAGSAALAERRQPRLGRLGHRGAGDRSRRQVHERDGGPGRRTPRSIRPSMRHDHVCGAAGRRAQRRRRATATDQRELTAS